ncbi:MAG: STAS domain-containing protein [Rubrobacteridae bacterium]|nr:STAS domain-containing protein [Rubrobacteridae bacterium]
MQERKLYALKVKTTRINNINLITASGECEFCSVQLLKDAMTDVIKSDNKKLIVEIGRLQSSDNSAIAAILWARHKMSENEGKLVVVGLNCIRMKNAIGDLVSVATSIKEAAYSLNKESFGYNT